MATIALYASKINQMPGLIKDVKQSVTDYKSELSELRKKSLTINKSVCDLDDVISAIQSSSQTQDQKIASLEAFNQHSEEFITDTARVDSEVAEIVRRRKDDFYEKYQYLKPGHEKSWKEDAKDWFASAKEWCKEHWKQIVTIIIVIVAVVVVIVCFPELVLAILPFVIKGSIFGAAIGGLMGGLTSLFHGGSFWEGFKDGAVSGAIYGAVLGGFSGIGHVLAGSSRVILALGGAEKILKVISNTAKISGGLASFMFGFDLLAWGIDLFDPSNPVVEFNHSLHSSKLYNEVQFAIYAIAAFSSGAYLGMKQGAQACFVAGTMILTAAGVVAIENIKVGDRVIATNPETFERAEKPVVKTYVHKVTQLVHLKINKELITTTYDHPFYVKGKGFLNEGELRTGEAVGNFEGGSYAVENIRFEIVESPETVYNFQVEDYHTYHVGHIGVLVHNKNYENGSVTEEVVEWGTETNKIPDNDSIVGHIFRDAEGHIPDNTLENRALLEDVANNIQNFRGIDKYGNKWFTKILEDGSEVWVESRNGNIFDGGINESPKQWKPDTGLKK